MQGLEIIFIILGLVLLSFGANIMVSGVVSFAKRFRVSKILISSVIIGLGTSFPELFVSIKANLAGSPEIVMGNIIGSNIANIFLVLGFAALIHPIISSEKAVKREILIMLFATVLLIVFVFISEINRFSASLMLIILIAYLGYSTLDDKKKLTIKNQSNHQSDKDNAIELKTDGSFLNTDSLSLNFIYAFGGLGLLLFGADLLVENAIVIARAFGLSEAVIGLSLIAVGTSLPELATAITASIKKHSEVVLGNVIGSCIMNILFILGSTGAVIPFSINPMFLSLDVWVMLSAALILSLLVLTNRAVHLPIGIFFLASYFVYSAYLYGLF